MTDIQTKSLLSQNASQIEASITMAITALANQLKREGKPVIGMSAGEPDFDTPDYIKDAGKAAIDDGQTKYTAAPGMPQLKESVCKKIQTDLNLTYQPDEVIVSCGAKHSIFMVLFALLNPGDEVIIPSPYWVSYPDQVKMLGGSPVFIETTDTSNFKITATQLEAAITDKTKLVILNTPSNPTGMIYTKEELTALAAVIVKHDILVISDEIYSKLVYDEAHVSIASLGDEIKKRTLLVDGVSKAYSMTGWRVGYTAGPKEIISVMGRLQSHSTSNPATPSQWASLAALNGNDDAIETMKVAFRERKKVMVDSLNAIAGITCLDPQGAFYAFPNISSTFGKRSQTGVINNSVDFCSNFLQEQLVACVPGSGFGAEGFIRLSYATSMDAIKSAMDKLDKFVSSLN